MAAKKKSFVQQFNLMMKSVRTLAQIRLPGVAVVSEDVRSRLPRGRADFEAQLPRVAALSRANKLHIEGHPLDTIEAELGFIGQLQAARDALAEVVLDQLRSADDTLLVRRSALWMTFLAHYGLLAQLAETNPDVENKLKSVVDFMANGPRPKVIVTTANDNQETKTTPDASKAKAAGG